MSTHYGVIVGAILSIALFGLGLYFGWRQLRAAKRAELVAEAYFDLYEAWALNRRAQLAEPDHQMLRTSSAQFHTAALRLCALLEDAELAELTEFMTSMSSGLGTHAGTLWKLHESMSRALKYRKKPVDTALLKSMFWPAGDNIPDVVLDRVPAASMAQQLGDANTSPTPTPTDATGSAS